MMNLSAHLLVSLALLISVSAQVDIADIAVSALTTPERLTIGEHASSILRLVEGGAADELLTKVQRLYDQRERQGTARAGGFVAPPSRSPGKRNSEIINSLLGLPKFLRGSLLSDQKNKNSDRS
ncbi:uncharacterized protein LOC108671444 [Hyalella azteca]|uniref:Uncharacterized protein LOC108671444 n=1 Tax=Hyalella azteca TaxID=294128 RepID=A0A8B7NMQ4_HYAAZ|nr:uncharacterized protein LOC108671444 [Hyalella azteca]